MNSEQLTFVVNRIKEVRHISWTERDYRPMFRIVLPCYCATVLPCHQSALETIPGKRIMIE